MGPKRAGSPAGHTRQGRQQAGSRQAAVGAPELWKKEGCPQGDSGEAWVQLGAGRGLSYFPSPERDLA